jgi:hypothetical protein
LSAGHPPELPEGPLRYEGGVPVALLAVGTGLVAVPPSIGELTALRHIDLDGNA